MRDLVGRDWLNIVGISMPLGKDFVRRRPAAVIRSRARAARLLHVELVCTAILTVGLSLSGSASSNADATGTIPVGAGAGIRLANATNAPWCTVGAVGSDRFGNIVGITAGHCAGATGEPVYLASAATDAPAIGYVDFISPPTQLDYAVIVLDAERVRPVNSQIATRIDDIAAPPELGVVVCKYGHTTGQTCGAVVSSSAGQIRTWAFSFYGDSGGPLLSGHHLVGICGGGQGLPTVYRTMVGIIADIDARAGAGANFVLTGTD